MKILKILKIAALTAGILAAGAGFAVNQGSEFNYQGELNSGGTPADGAFDLEFQLFNVASGGTEVDMITLGDVTVTDGVFSVEIDFGHPVFLGDQYWLEVAVRAGASTGSYETLLPRQPINAVPYAMGLVPGAVVDANLTGGSTSAITGVNGSSLGGRGLVGLSTSLSGAGSGVRGEADSNASGATGVFGILTNASATGAGIKGQNNGTSGYGVWGQGGANATGVLGQTNSSTAQGAVWAVNTGAGVGLKAQSRDGNIIEGWDSAPINKVFQVDNAGNVTADGSFTSPAADFAEMLPAMKGLEPADVLVIGSSGELIKSTMPYQQSVAGVYSTKPAFIGGMKDNLDMEANVPLAVVGIIPVKVSGENGMISPGDLLTTSMLAGHAMRANADAPNGSIIGKALETLDAQTGQIKVLMVLQ